MTVFDQSPREVRDSSQEVESGIDLKLEKGDGTSPGLEYG